MCTRSYRQPWCMRGSHHYGAVTILRDDLCGQAKFFGSGVGNCQRGIQDNNKIFKNPVIACCTECQAKEEGKKNKGKKKVRVVEGERGFVEEKGEN